MHDAGVQHTAAEILEALAAFVQPHFHDPTPTPETAR